MNERPLPVVIVHWNRPDRCLATVAAFVAQSVPVRVAVVDNGSPPGALARLREGLPAGVELVEAGRNLGFGPAANVGFRHWLAVEDVGDWIALAPHDALPDTGCLATMLAALAERPRAGLACADYGDGATPIVDPYFGGILAPATVTEGWEPAGHPHGTLLLARQSCLREVGLFDERYFAYCEEADLGLRARDAGWDVGLVRGAMVRNPDVGSASAAVDYLQLRNTLLLVREHSGRYHATIRLLLAIVQLAEGLVTPSRRGPYWSVAGRLRAMLDYARGRFGPPPPALLAR
jgi:GT2 family glycosyltransferase